MSRLIFIVTIAIIILASGTMYFASRTSRPEKNGQNPPTVSLNINQKKDMKLTSPAFAQNTNIPPKYTCDGDSINPPLEISGVPSVARSLSLIIDDPDAPVPGGFVHWVLFNLDPQTKNIAENSLPADAIQGQNSSGQSKYTGPCPPSGTHRYFFKLYALDDVLGLDSAAKREDVEAAMEGHILEQTELLGLYQRPQ